MPNASSDHIADDHQNHVGGHNASINQDAGNPQVHIGDLELSQLNPPRAQYATPDTNVLKAYRLVGDKEMIMGRQGLDSDTCDHQDCENGTITYGWPCSDPNELMVHQVCVGGTKLTGWG